MAILGLWRKTSPAVAIFAVVGLGFLAAYMIQGKYFFYHVYPAALFAEIAAAIGVFQRLHETVTASLADMAMSLGTYLLALGTVAVLFAIGFNDRRPEMTDLAWARGLSRPTALSVSPDLATGFPLARQVDAIWVDRTHSQWIARYTRYGLLVGAPNSAQRELFASYHRANLAWILHQIAAKKPDLIFQEARPGYAWLDLELRELDPNYLQGYQTVAEEGGIRVLRRQSP